MEYLKYRFNDRNQEVMNKERGIMRKISSLKSFYNYYYRNERIKNNPAALVQLPKLHEKEISGWTWMRWPYFWTRWNKVTS